MQQQTAAPPSPPPAAAQQALGLRQILFEQMKAALTGLNCGRRPAPATPSSPAMPIDAAEQVRKMGGGSFAVFPSIQLFETIRGMLGGNYMAIHQDCCIALRRNG